MHIYYKGIKFNYEIIGQGSPVLFLHGWGGNMDSFLPTYQSMSRNHKCILVDFIGFGDSEMPNTPYTLSDYVESVKLLLETLEIFKVDIICHSFGGRVALKLMAENEKLVGKAILVAPAGVKPRRGVKYYLSVWNYKLHKKLYKLKLVTEEKLNSLGTTEYLELVPTMRKTFINVVNEDLTPMLKYIESQVLLIYGDNDTAVPLYMIEKIKQEIKGSEYITLQGGHFCYLHENGVFNRIAHSFLD